MKIHIVSQTVFSTEEVAYLDYRGRTMRAEDRTAEGFWAREGYADFRLPTVPDGWKQTSTPVNMGDYWTWQVVAKTEEELAIEKQRLINSVFDAAEHYVDHKGKVDGSKGKVSKYSIGVLTLKASGNKPKSKAINDWVNSIFTLAYTREAQLNGGMPWSESMLDFSSCGELPGTIAEALQE